MSLHVTMRVVHTFDDHGAVHPKVRFRAQTVRGRGIEEFVEDVEPTLVVAALRAVPEVWRTVIDAVHNDHVDRLEVAK